MAPIDIVVLAVIGIAFVAVCVRIYRKGTCADCAQGGARLFVGAMPRASLSLIHI